MASISSCFTATLKSRRHNHSKALAPRPSTNFHTPHFPRIPSNSRALLLPFLRASSIEPGPPHPAMETDQLPSDVRKRAMDAVDACGGRVTIGDAASMAGLNLHEAQKALQALAADTNGFLEVSDEGDVIYIFPEDYSLKLAAKSFRLKFESFAEKAQAAADKFMRVSFGTALIASIGLVFSAIVFIMINISDSDGGGSYGSSLLDIGIRVTGEGISYKSKNNVGRNFIESIFSFVFGDGDPNHGIEEQRWKLIGGYITFSGGVVTAEELAPYLDVGTTNGSMNDEYILPVLLRFDGQPEIDQEGNILYRFPTLQRTASSQGRRRADSVGEIEKHLKEKKWRFSKTSILHRAMVFVLGGLNLFGVIVLGYMLKEVAVSSSKFIKFVVVIFPFLQIYAASFFIVPLFRWILICKRNADIEKRNQAREQRASALERPDLSLSQKLLSAQEMAQRTVIGQDRIVYSTDKDLFEQDYEAQDWNSRFLDIVKSD